MLICGCMAGCAKSGTTSKQSSSPSPKRSTSSTSTKGTSTVADLSDDLFSFQFLTNGHIYQLPMYYSDFTALGWQPAKDGSNDDLPKTVPAGKALTSFYMENNGVPLRASLINLSKNELPCEKCLVGGVDIGILVSSGWQPDGPELYLPKGIQYGVSKQSDIEAAYGKPTDSFSGDLYTELTYSADTYSEIKLFIYKDTGTLKEIDITNYVKPKGFNEGSASDKTPADVSSYQAPTQLGDDILSYNMTIDGKLYHTPFPVKELIKNGWSVVKDKSPSEIASNDSGSITIRKGNLVCEIFANNKASYATTPENCTISDVTLNSPSPIAGGTALQCDWKLPGGIYSGMTQAALEATLKKNVKYYTKETHGDPTLVDYAIYKDAAKEFYNFIVTTYNGKVANVQIFVR